MGAEQHYRLGQYIRHRYVSILSSSYINTEILIRSTNFTRTIKSAQSNLMGLYALLNTSDDKIPDLFIPIHTVPLKQDFVLRIISKNDKFILCSFSYSVQIIVQDMSN